MLLQRLSIIISSQAVAGSVLREPEILAKLAQEAISGGADGIRAAGSETISAIRKITDLPVIGLIKTERQGFKPRISCTSVEIATIAEAGADVVAIDATNRTRPEPLSSLFKEAKSRGLEIFADIATFDEAVVASDLGADYVATTMAGYTNDRNSTEGPDFLLLREIIRELQIPVFLEGRVRSADHINLAFSMGAYGVVVGRSVTSPRDITSALVKAVKG
jgi:N-acylglucosamine-6-phosphate 2-epimerase